MGKVLTYGYMIEETRSVIQSYETFYWPIYGHNLSVNPNPTLVWFEPNL
jgi:hypothetical protein